MAVGYSLLSFGIFFLLLIYLDREKSGNPVKETIFINRRNKLLLTTEEISFAMFHQLFFFFVCLLSAMNGGSTATK
jgi:hypothetical protein